MAVFPWQKPAASSATSPASAPVTKAAVEPSLPAEKVSQRLPDLTPTPAPRPLDQAAPMTIVRLTAENVKRLKAVSIAPDGNLVVLSGRNGQGKTSVLDSIAYALGGKPDVAEPVRRGEDAAEVVCDLGDLIVRRRWIAGGNTTLEVTSRDGLRYPSPQKILDDLVGRLAFDPLAFARMEPKKQRETLQKLVGLDFTADEQRAAAVFAERTAVNREVKAAAARLLAMPEYAGVPPAPLSAADVAGEMQRAQTTNNENATKRRAIESAKAACDAARDRCTRLRDELEKATEQLESMTAQLEQRMHDASELRDIDIAPITARLSNIDRTNSLVRANQQRAEVANEHARKIAHSEALTAELEAIAKRQVEAIEAAAMPVEGLGFSDAGVTLNGLPLEQGSAAEQLRVSVAIALAMNPRLRVLLVRDASLLDHDSLRMVAEMAAEANAQVWLERVEEDAATTVVIEDGEVRV